MKRLFCFLLLFTLVLSACNNTDTTSSSSEAVSSAYFEEVSSADDDFSSQESSEITSSVEEVEIVLDDGYEGFISVSGRNLVDESGKEYFIKGMAFGNGVFGNPEVPPSTHHTKKDYEKLSEMGFNNVRFYLNYGIFESDLEPYSYNEDGFIWLDRNIEWAKEYGIRLVLNMHYPQGGYQSGGDGHALWTEPENMNRLSALWTEIARRYADEPTILGYGLINEPIVAVEKTTDAIDVYTTAVQGMVDSIRKVNDTQIIFVEKIHTVQEIDTWKRSWPDLNGRHNFPVIADDNIVYEFHFYNPLDFTHQWKLEEIKSYPYKKDGNLYDKSSMALDIKKYVDFSKKYNVPVYCGEFGISTDCFKDGANGTQWVCDILDIFLENGVNFNYHAFHEEMFGLYMNWSYSAPDKLNIPLCDLFTEKLK